MWERPAILASRVFKHRGGVPRLLQAQLRPDDRGLPLHRPRSAKVAALDDDMAALGDRFLTNGVMGWEYLLVTARGSGPHRQPSSRSLSNLRETLPSTAFSPPDAAVPKRPQPARRGPRGLHIVRRASRGRAGLTSPTSGANGCNIDEPLPRLSSAVLRRADALGRTARNALTRRFPSWHRPLFRLMRQPG
jgi:hypothetical protein